MESMHTDIRVLRVRCFSAPVSAGHKMIHFMFVLIIFFFNYRTMTIIRSKFVSSLHRSVLLGRGKTKHARCHSFHINSLAADSLY